jgi:hypothetical protein
LVSVVGVSWRLGVPSRWEFGQADQRVQSKVFEQEGFEFAAGVYGLLTDRWSRVYLLPWPPLAWQVRRAAAQAGLGGNMRKAVVLGIALLVTSVVVLGGTVFRQQVADASSILSVFVTNDSSHPVPVREQNLDASGNIKVHEQGTANVNVTNSSLSVTAPAVTDGGGGIKSSTQENGPELLPLCSLSTTGTCTATALVITMTDNVEGFRLSLSSGGTGASFIGPANFGASNIVIPLSRPVTFDSIWCKGPVESGVPLGTCTVSWTGAQP